MFEMLAVHGWIYGLHDGLLWDLNVTVNGIDQAMRVSEVAISALNLET
jgi:hypothetical protein